MAFGSIKVNKFFQDMLNAHFLSTSNPPTQMKIGTGTTTPAVADTDLETPVLTQSLLSGFPTVDTGSLQAQTKILVGTTEANGNNITECGEFDASGNLQSHNVFDAESKTNTDIFIIVETTKIRNKT